MFVMVHHSILTQAKRVISRQRVDSHLQVRVQEPGELVRVGWVWASSIGLWRKEDQVVGVDDVAAVSKLERVLCARVDGGNVVHSIVGMVCR